MDIAERCPNLFSFIQSNMIMNLFDEKQIVCRWLQRSQSFDISWKRMFAHVFLSDADGSRHRLNYNLYRNICLFHFTMNNNGLYRSPMYQWRIKFDYISFVNISFETFCFLVFDLYLSTDWHVRWQKIKTFHRKHRRFVLNDSQWIYRLLLIDIFVSFIDSFHSLTYDKLDPFNK
jgi:hypothetical protein